MTTRVSASTRPVHVEVNQTHPEPALLVQILPHHRVTLRARFPGENEQDIIQAILEWIRNRPDFVLEIQEIHEVLQTLKALR